MALSASDLPTMYTLLANSLSGDQSLCKPAESALAQSESRPGFCSCLMEVISSRDLAALFDLSRGSIPNQRGGFGSFSQNRKGVFGFTGG